MVVVVVMVVLDGGAESGECRVQRVERGSRNKAAAAAAGSRLIGGRGRALLHRLVYRSRVLCSLV